MTLERSIFRQLAGICATPKAEPGCWRYAGGMLVIELARAPDLKHPGGAIRVEKSRGLPTRVLVFRDGEGRVRAMENRCSHAGRRLDLDGDSEEIVCCSIGSARYDLKGHVAGGWAREDLQLFSVEEHDGRVLVQV
ncbi:MAG: Rieske (2Fe-2S) protein [Myxococcota bacterium]